MICFIHIPKTGGRSIINLLGGDEEWKHASVHRTARQLKEILGEDWNRYYKFAIFRNPWDKMVSLYFYSKNCPELHGQRARLLDFNGWIKEVYSGIYEDYLVHNLSFVDFFCGNQVNWVEDENGELMTEVVRFECLFDRDRATALEYQIILNLGCGEMPHVNQSVHEEYINYYNAESERLVRKHFERDIKLFGYEF